MTNGMPAFHKTEKQTLYHHLTLSQTVNCRLFQTKRVCNNNFEFSENLRKFSKWVENTVGKGEIARDEQFLLFQQCFQKPLYIDM